MEDKWCIMERSWVSGVYCFFQAEAAFMVARGMVREAHGSLETLQVRLKEVRDRLDRVSREEAHYLELATLEHKLLQEERRLRTAYENAESSEREKFALFSAAVRGSHEKERTRAERTKNWSIIGSVLGALIGVMGSTYINRVRLQVRRGDDNCWIQWLFISPALLIKSERMYWKPWQNSKCWSFFSADMFVFLVCRSLRVCCWKPRKVQRACRKPSKFRLETIDPSRTSSERSSTTSGSPWMRHRGTSSSRTSKVWP